MLATLAQPATLTQFVHSREALTPQIRSKLDVVTLQGEIFKTVCKIDCRNQTLNQLLFLSQHVFVNFFMKRRSCCLLFGIMSLN